MAERRLEDLEIKFAYQEQSLQQLNDTVYRQQQQIDRLTRLGERLLERLSALEQPTASFPGEEPPPHY